MAFDLRSAVHFCTFAPDKTTESHKSKIDLENARAKRTISDGIKSQRTVIR
jgi:hypothetical protein